MNPFKELTKFEWCLWLGSLLTILITCLLSPAIDPAVLCALLIGATALIFVSKGHPLGQILTVLFALVYAWISLQNRYYGEMITYLGMTGPIAVAAVITWIKNPAKQGSAEVKVSSLSRKLKIWLVLLTVLVTVFFYFVLKALDTPNLFWSTVSIATSFSASYLTVFRSPYYALAYAANDVVLIILWICAGLSDPSFFPMVICFLIFLINDSYGFFNWQRMRRKQQSEIKE
ncbi:MAG: nicotinamide mononucleotide transporter [Clostridia bacterium]|nr:nicotinamide mononucleotide transporter [Clostridia bacterium]